MPRQARLDAPGTLHHVMIRGIGSATIFDDDGDRRNFLSRIGKLVGNTGTRILAWVQMDNHVYLLLFRGQSGISRTGGRRRKVTEVRARMACWLSREMGISMAEIARNLGVGASAIAMAIKKEESSEKD